LLAGPKDHKRCSWKEFEKQLYDDDVDDSATWTELKKIQARVGAIQHQEEEEAEVKEIAVKQMAAVELMTIVGPRGYPPIT
jgi:hypothetical protein